LFFAVVLVLATPIFGGAVPRDPHGIRARPGTRARLPPFRGKRLVAGPI